MADFTHLDENGKANMVDVTWKEVTERTAVAAGIIRVGKEVFEAIKDESVPKGDVFSTARIAGIMAAKRTSELIPLCHPLMLTKVAVDFEMLEEDYSIRCICTAKLAGKTGVEMEALTGAGTALLTIYDMCKAISKSMVIDGLCLLEKSGGKSGHYVKDKDSSLSFNEQIAKQSSSLTKA